MLLIWTQRLAMGVTQRGVTQRGVDLKARATLTGTHTATALRS